MKTPDPKNAASTALRLSKFQGTDNPRQLRVIQALMARPRCREDIDHIAGCSNGPDLIAGLRGLGLKLPCERIKFFDRDGHECRPGVYSLTSKDRRLIWAWQATLKQGGRHE